MSDVFNVGDTVIVVNPNSCNCREAGIVTHTHDGSACSVVFSSYPRGPLLFSNWELEKPNYVDKAIKMLQSLGYTVTKKG